MMEWKVGDRFAHDKLPGETFVIQSVWPNQINAINEAHGGGHSFSIPICKLEKLPDNSPDNPPPPPEPESSKELIEATAIKFARWATDNNWHLQLGADLWINFTSMEQANSKGVYAIFASALNKHKGENNQGKH